MQKITPFLWFDGTAEEAMNFYTSVFKDSKIVQMTRCGDHGPGPKGSVFTGTMELAGQQFMVLNGGPRYQFTPAISFMVHCSSQAEVDEYWEKLTPGGQPMSCGWLKDKFGISWQIIPNVLGQLLNDYDPGRSARAAQAMMKMTKIDIAALQQAADGE